MKLKVRIVATAVCRRTATSFSAALVEMPSVGSGEIRPGSVGPSNGKYQQ